MLATAFGASRQRFVIARLFAIYFKFPSFKIWIAHLVLRTCRYFAFLVIKDFVLFPSHCERFSSFRPLTSTNYLDIAGRKTLTTAETSPKRDRTSQVLNLTTISNKGRSIGQLKTTAIATTPANRLHVTGLKEIMDSRKDSTGSRLETQIVKRKTLKAQLLSSSRP